MRKYAFLGPESTGKSTTAQLVAEQLQGIYIPEMARDYLATKGLQYTYHDILEIAHLQSSEESRYAATYPDSILLCDTEFITIEIWLEFLNYDVPQWIPTQIRASQYICYFLFDIDIPWVADPLRANENDREQLFRLFIEKLTYYQKPYHIIRGRGYERITQVMEKIER